MVSQREKVQAEPTILEFRLGAGLEQYTHFVKHLPVCESQAVLEGSVFGAAIIADACVWDILNVAVKVGLIGSVTTGIYPFLVIVLIHRVLRSCRRKLRHACKQPCIESDFDGRDGATL